MKRKKKKKKKKKRKRLEEYEQEKRMTILRERASKRGKTEDDHDGIADEEKQELKHVNLFETFDIFATPNPSSKEDLLANPEYKAEKKKKEEDYLKKIGVLTYLGQSAPDLNKNKPWLNKFAEEEKDLKKKRASERKIAEDDPLRIMNLKTGNAERNKPLEPIHRYRKDFVPAEREAKRLKTEKKNLNQNQNINLKHLLKENQNQNQ